MDLAEGQRHILDETAEVDLKAFTFTAIALSKINLIVEPAADPDAGSYKLLVVDDRSRLIIPIEAIKRDLTAPVLAILDRSRRVEDKIHSV